ncbi:MAG TPA: PAS domain S-box protein, partial [Gemmatimonadaceae bacterium]|nr:PAS domain S-box protein [Gemmatimonadaceae bacterium]
MSPYELANSRFALRVSEERFRLFVDGVRDYAMFILDPQGHIATWNAGAERIKGYRADEIIGRSFKIFYPPDAIARGWPDHELEVARRTGRFEDEGWRLRKDGSRFWANVLITAMRSADGTLEGFSKITRDLTERRRTEEALRQSEERFRLLVEGVADHALFLLDPDGRVASWNVGAERIKGYSADEILGAHFSRFYLPEDQDRPAQDLARALAEGSIDDEGWRRRKDGSRFWAGTTLAALRDREGHLTGFAKITRDLTERRRMESLEAAGRRVSEFLAMLSHELRNPLAPIQNALHAMRLRDIEDPAVRWSRDVIGRQVSHLSRLVDDLLDISRLTSGKIQITREPIELAVVVDRAVEASGPVIEARQHRLTLTQSDERLIVQGDVVRLTQVVSNLLLNAAKFTPERGTISLSLARDGREAVLSVRDTGMGIRASDLPMIFDTFAQVSQSPDRALGGLGIGLTLVRRLVRMHGGTVVARSAGVGRGSEFEVRLPLLRGAQESAAGAPVPEAPPDLLHPPRRVLVVDDNRDSADTTAMLLTMWGHEVQTAHDGPAALDVARTFRPQLVLLDIGLPGLTGYEVAEQLRASADGRSMVLAAMTGYGQE